MKASTNLKSSHYTIIIIIIIRLLLLLLLFPRNRHRYGFLPNDEMGLSLSQSLSLSLSAFISWLDKERYEGENVLTVPGDHSLAPFLSLGPHFRKGVYRNTYVSLCIEIHYEHRRVVQTNFIGAIIIREGFPIQWDGRRSNEGKKGGSRNGSESVIARESSKSYHLWHR